MLTDKQFRAVIGIDHRDTKHVRYVTISMGDTKGV